MDSPLAAHIFRQLFSRPARRCLYTKPRPRLRPSSSLPPVTPRHTRSYAIGLHKEDDGSGRSNWEQRLDAFPRDISDDLRHTARVTAADLRHRLQRPKRVKMHTRDFIEDALYNPSYGYFSKQATIFQPGQPFDFTSIPDATAFHAQLRAAYTSFEDDLDNIYYDDVRQLWHTPTELFQPHYGQAVARYLITNYKMSLYPYHDLIIYEIGAGNGTLMRNILDYIRDTDPSVYARTQYRIIEISPNLATLQKTAITLPHLSDPDHLDHIEIINQSIFTWTQPIHSPCFFLAFEVIDNWAHDSIRYNPYTEQPLQGSVLIDKDGEFFEFYEPHIDPLATSYLSLRQSVSRRPPRTPLTFPPKFIRHFYHSLPLTANLTVPEYIPTRLYQFFHILSRFFPSHRLLVSDFHYLPDACPGFSAPVVQTRYERRTIAVTTPYVYQGYFDIFFPTDFELMEDMYRAITGKLTRIQKQSEWLKGWGEEGGKGTTALNGEDVMAGWYGNQSIMTTV